MEKEAAESIISAEEPVSPDNLEKALRKPQAPAAAADDDNVPDPRAWSERRKVCTALLVSIGHLVTLMSASIVAPALPQIARDVNMSASTAQISFSVYFIGLAAGPFLIAALSETYGRRWVWMLSNLWYALWNALCPVGPSKCLLIAGRLLEGLGASAGLVLAGPIVADMYGPEKRGRSLAVASLFPYLGPAVGPIVGGIVSQHINWQWLFWILSIFDLALVGVGFFVLHETYAPVLRRRHYRQAHLETTMATDAALASSTWSRLAESLRRPFVLLCTRPIILIIGLVYAMDFGIYALLLSNYATLWIERYHQSTQTSSLHYISIALGFTVAAQLGGRLTDCIWKRLKEPSGGQITPEYRVPMMVPSALLLPVSLLWYGWCAENRVAWPAVDVAMFLFNVGSCAWSQAVLAYMIDEFKDHAASASAATRVMSNIFAFAFPIFAPEMYRRLGYGWGNSLLALIVIALGWPTPFILWKYGAYLRSIGKPSSDKIQA